MITMRKTMAALAAAATLGALALTGCVQTPTTGVEAGDGPAAEQTVEPAEEAIEDTTTDEVDPTEGERNYEEGTYEAEPAEEGFPEPAIANFEQKYTYEDGVEVEVTKMKHGKISADDAEYAEPEAQRGDPYVTFTIRVRNNSKVIIDSYQSMVLTYGPDGEEAVSPYLASANETDISGKLLPGKSKSGTDSFVIPAKYQDDVVLEVNVDMEHESAVFSGSVK